MLSLKEIEGYYPAPLRVFKKNLLREYLQYKILEIVFNTDYAAKLSFIGGTSIRIIHNINRFSEDLDFDNFELVESDFENITESVSRKLRLEGYEAEIKNVYKGAYNCSIRIPDILFESKLTGHRQEKVLIKIQTQPHNFEYSPEKFILNKFEVFTQINVTPIDILLSMKILAILGRKRAMGRDFYDTIFMFGKTKPSYDYLKLKIGVDNVNDLKTVLLEKSRELDFKVLANDVKPFLTNPDDSRKVLLFAEYLKDLP